jgi:hypothetical protein
MPGILGGGSGQRGLGIIDGVRRGLTPARQAMRSGVTGARSNLQSATRGVTIQQSLQDARANVRAAITGEETDENGQPTRDANGRFVRQPAEGGVSGPGGRQFQFQSEAFIEPGGVGPGMKPTTRRLQINTGL